MIPETICRGGNWRFMCGEMLIPLSSFNQYPKDKTRGEMLSRATGLPRRAAPAHIITIISKGFHSPLYQKKLFNSQSKLVICLMEKYPTTHSVTLDHKKYYSTTGYGQYQFNLKLQPPSPVRWPYQTLHQPRVLYVEWLNITTHKL